MSQVKDTHRPSPHLVVREHAGRPYFEAKFRVADRQVKRRIGAAWLERDPDGGWRPRRGRVQDGYFDRRTATVEAARIVERYLAEADERRHGIESSTRRAAQGPTFREVAHAYLHWLENVQGAKPATLRDHRAVLAEPGLPYKRGRGVTKGYVMAALGDRPAKAITTAEIEALLSAIAATGVGPRTPNKARNIIRATFNYGRRAHGVTHNPAAAADKRRERQPAPLAYYRVEEIEALGRALADGLHRPDPELRSAFERWEDERDAEAVRVAAYTGVRLGELLALRWRDVDFARATLTVSRALSAGVEGTPKSGRYRQVPLADQAAAALERLSHRLHYVAPDDLVICNELGRHLDGSALRRRFKRARDAAGLEPLRFHDLRHTFGSLLVAGGIDLQSVRDALGHADLATTARYLHARPATERAAEFTRALSAGSGEVLTTIAD